MSLQHTPPKGYAGWNKNSQKTARSKARKEFERAGETVPAWCARRAGDPWDVAAPPGKARTPRQASGEAPTAAPAPPVATTAAPRREAPTPPRHGPWAMAVATTFISAVAFAVAATGVLGDYGLLRGLADYLLPGSLDVYHGWPGTLGAAAAVGVLGGKWVSGHLLAERLWERRRDALTWLLVSAIVIFLVSEMLGAYVREVQAHAQHVKESMGVVHVESPLVACPAETMPQNVYGYKQIDSWQAGATARQKACMDSVAKQATAQRGELVAAADQHSMFEVPLLMLWAAGMCLSTCAAAGSFGVFVRSVIAIFAIPAAWLKREKPAKAPAPAPTPAPVAATPRVSFWRRLMFPFGTKQKAATP